MIFNCTRSKTRNKKLEIIFQNLFPLLQGKGITVDLCFERNSRGVFWVHICRETSYEGSVIWKLWNRSQCRMMSIPVLSCDNMIWWPEPRSNFFGFNLLWHVNGRAWSATASIFLFFGRHWKLFRRYFFC